MQILVGLLALFKCTIMFVLIIVADMPGVFIVQHVLFFFFFYVFDFIKSLIHKFICESLILF